MKIIYAEDDCITRIMVISYLEKILESVEITEFDNGVDAVEYMKTSSDYDLIISDYQMENGNGSIIYEWLKKNRENAVPFFLISCNSIFEIEEFDNFDKDNVANHYLKKPVYFYNFKKSLLEIIEAAQIKVTYADPEKYVKVRIPYFYRCNKVLSDIYAKVSDDKYVKVMNKGDLYHKKDIDKYKERGANYLYLKDEDFKKFEGTLTEKPFLKVETEGLDEEEKKELMNFGFATVQALAESIGITKDSMEIADKYFDEVISKAKFRELVKILKEIKNRKDFLFDHSLLLSYMVVEASKYCDWYSEEITKKLCMAAIFHDITLDNSRLVLTDFLEDVKIELSQKEKKRVHNHPMHAANLVQQSNIESLFDVDIYILNHHEKPDGSGYPKGLGARDINPVSCFFNISHEFIRLLFKHEFDENKYFHIIQDIQERYNIGNYGHGVKGLIEYIKSFYKDPFDFFAEN
jgi:response regulator RpfG family c-di-GMP phosphodiesterase